MNKAQTANVECAEKETSKLAVVNKLKKSLIKIVLCGCGFKTREKWYEHKVKTVKERENETSS